MYRPRARMCLLKGCESWFEPECPQQRYCRGACVDAAGAWSAWKARCRYRESPKGRRARQKGSREYRTRRAARENREGGFRRPARQRASSVRKLPPLRPRPSRGSGSVPASTLVSLRPTWRSRGAWSLPQPGGAAVLCRRCRTVSEGVLRGSSLSRAGEISCDRPGCYELFVRTRRSPARRFCGKPCRRALERVWQREARWHARRGLG